MRYLILISQSMLLFAMAGPYWLWENPIKFLLLPVMVVIFLVINILPTLGSRKLPTTRLGACAGGVRLLILFLSSSALLAGFYTAWVLTLSDNHWQTWLIGALVATVMEVVVFWNGIARVYLTSVQLGVKTRIVGILCGWIPLLNLWALIRIIRITSREVDFESEKIRMNQARHAQQICRTRYPILFVHGVFFRDFKHLNYWGRIPDELIQNGATVYYGRHQSAASVEDSAAELADRIQCIVEQTGCEKVNIIAHSKGGLDCRWAISCLGAAPYVASVTTINSPHRGCLFAEHLLQKIPKSTLDFMARSYNQTMKKLGDKNPDFIASVKDLTQSRCQQLNKQMPDQPNIYCQSVGSKLNRAISGKFPLNISYPMVKRFDGANDGLVSIDSFEWGQAYTFLSTDQNRGISHGDVIDLYRENIPGFDVREFYVQMVSDLKVRGL